MKKTLSLIVVLIMLVGLVSACAGTTPTASPAQTAAATNAPAATPEATAAPNYKTSMTIVRAMDIDSLDPILLNYSESISLCELMYDTLPASAYR